MGSRLRALQVLETRRQTKRSRLKMDSKLVFPLTLLFIATLIDSGSSLQCYVCNSYEDALCADPFFHDDVAGEAQPKSGDDFVQQCPDDGKEYFCRKIYQNVRGDERVIRSVAGSKTRRIGIATQQSWRSTTLMCALARASSATAPPRSPSLLSPSCPPWPLAT